MDKIFVLGSNSFSGAHFTEYALSEGAAVWGISRSSEPPSIFLPYRNKAVTNFNFFQYDLNNNLNEIIELTTNIKPTYFVNFASLSMVGESWLAPGDWFLTNTVSTIKLHDELRKLNVLKRYVHISTPEVYGNKEGLLQESFNFNPSTPYAVSRAATDFSLQTFFNTYQFPVVTTRAANVYGPCQQLYRIIPRTILYVLLGKKLQLHGGGKSLRSFIHIQDVARATWRIMQDGINGQTYHISTAKMLSIIDLVKCICEKLNVDFEKHTELVEDRLGKDVAYELDSSKLRTELQWQPTYELETGLDECIDWVKSNFEILKNLPFNYQHKP
jgi:dTDP-glucose 4,6-dehydratase